ncbi:MAG: serine--tRNA ligase, partial [Bacteroidota bacterium]
MLDIKFIRENADIVKMAAQKKHITIDIDRLLAVDDSRRELMKKMEGKKAEQNRVSADIVAAQDPVVKQQLITEMQDLKAEIQKDEGELKPILEEWQALMLQVPQIPDMTVPEGLTDVDNQEVKAWGEKPEFDFTPKDHISLMTELGMADFERGSKVHGFRGYYLLGDGARLSWAIWNYAQDFFQNKGFVPMLPPAIVRKENLYG